MFDLLPPSPMNAVLPVEIHHVPPAVNTDGINSVDLGGDDLPPKKFMVTGIAVLSGVDFGDPSYPPKK